MRPAREGIAPIGKPVHADIASAMVGFLSLKKLMRLLQRRVRAGCSARRGAQKVSPDTNSPVDCSCLANSRPLAGAACKARAQGPRAQRDTSSDLPPTD